MLHKTPGIVLNYIKYRETSIIVKVFTELFGLQTYIVNGIRSTKGRNKIGFYQPLNLLDMVVYHKKGADINRVSEVKYLYLFKTIPFNIKKSSIAIFMTEVLAKTIRGEFDNRKELFNFVQQSILILDQLDGQYENFHIQLLIKLSRFLGFSPSSGEELIRQIANPDQEIKEDEAATLSLLIRAGYDDVLPISNDMRRNLLSLLLDFYKSHITSLGEIKSLPVLKEVMH